MKDLKLYTDGSSDPWSAGKPVRPGGWAYVVQDGDMESASWDSLMGKGSDHMELLAVERGLASIEKHRHTGVEILTDSGPVRKRIRLLIEGESPDSFDDYTELTRKIAQYMRHLEYTCVTFIQSKAEHFPQHQTCHDLANHARLKLRESIGDLEQRVAA